MADDPTHCDACGELIPVPSPLNAELAAMREQDGEEAGRMTWLYDGRVIHQCAFGAFLPPGQDAPPKSG